MDQNAGDSGIVPCHPEDVLLLVFQDLELNTLLACMNVCVNWKNVIETYPKLFWWKHGRVKAPLLRKNYGSYYLETVAQNHIIHIPRKERPGILMCDCR